MSKDNEKQPPIDSKAAPESLDKKIKDMENKAREDSKKHHRVHSKKEDTVSFEEWHSMRSKSIPAHHLREIIKADFKARGLQDMASMKEYDDALSKYGVRL